MKTHRHKPIGQPRFGCSGFSLLELLTAISIISLLAAILLPAFSRAKHSAYRTTSRNNLKQLITAYLMYEHDYGHTIPYDRSSSNSAWALYFSRMESFGEKTLLTPRCQKSSADGLGTAQTAWAFGNPTTIQSSTATPTLPPALTTISQLNFQYVSGPPPNVPPGPGIGSGIITIDLQPGQPVYFLAMAENVATDFHTLAVFQPSGPVWGHMDYVNQQPINAIPGLKVGLGGNGAWDFWQWKGPLAKRLYASISNRGIGSPTTGGISESGTYPAETYNPHTTPTGLDKATSIGKGNPVSGIVFPNGYAGWTDVNYIYMGTWLEATSAMSIKIAVAGDDVLSAFVGTPASALSPTPITPVATATSSQPISSSYSINAWAQAGNSQALILGQGVFYTQADQGDSNVPIFTEGIWADLIAQPDDPIPMNTDGTNNGLGRAYLDRYGDGKNNVSFMDSHVDGVKLNALWQLPWHRKWPTPAR